MYVCYTAGVQANQQGRFTAILFFEGTDFALVLFSLKMSNHEKDSFIISFHVPYILLTACAKTGSYYQEQGRLA